MSTSVRLHALFATLLGTAFVAVGCNGTLAVEPDAGKDGGIAPTPDGSVLPDGATVPDSGVRDASPDATTLPPFNTKVCLSPDELAYLFPKDATLASGIDFLGGYRVDGQSKPTGIVASTHSVGTACKTATDMATCTSDLAAFDETTPMWGCQGFCPPFPGQQVRTSQGDRVTVIGKREDVKKAFLPIDRPSEAVAAVAARYSNSDCTKDNVLVNPDGTYVVRVSSYTCTPDPKDTTKSINSVDEFAYKVSADGTIAEVGSVRVSEQKNEHGCPVAGRKPQGLAPANSNGGACAGSYFARMAHLEAASVVAFAHMADELRVHGAPEELVARAVHALFDERRHADVIGQLANAHGAQVPVLKVERGAVRSLLDRAIENRREGCVRETYGALLALYQAQASTAPEVRHTMARVAADEAQHAALSWDLDAWLMQKLDSRERALVLEAEKSAVAALEAECAQSFDADTRSIVGLPSREIALDLFAKLCEGLSLAA